MKTIPIEQAIREIKAKIDRDPDACFAPFLGAGCSVSSGIPAAGGLVRKWMPLLQEQATGRLDGWEEWARGAYPQFVESPALLYSAVIDEVFQTAREKQQEIERVVDVREPIGFGYVTLAQLMTHAKYGGRFNVVLTTNFDDLIADALYLYTLRKPRVIGHDLLSDFAVASSDRPLIIKVHGDAHVPQRHTSEDLAALPESMAKAIAETARNRGLLFLGYGGNDEGVAAALSALRSPPPYPVYWINEAAPGPKLAAWLDRVGARWAKHTDFDLFGALLFEKFALVPPDFDRLKNLEIAYAESSKKLRRTQSADSAVASAVGAVGEALDWWTIGREALALETSDPDAAKRKYEEGLALMPKSSQLLGNYALFLDKRGEALERIEPYYVRALEADPKNAINVGNYAVFLENRVKDLDRARKHYERAIEIDPKAVANLGNYAVFLDRRGDYDGAEKLYQRAFEVDPHHAGHLANYAVFLDERRGDLDKAEEYYQRADAADPKNAANLGNYAVFLKGRRQDYDRAESYFERAIAADPRQANNLGNYAVFLESQRKDFDRAQTMYERAIEADPRHALNLANYAEFLDSQRSDSKRSEELFRRSLEVDPQGEYARKHFATLLEKTGRKAEADALVAGLAKAP